MSTLRSSQNPSRNADQTATTTFTRVPPMLRVQAAERLVSGPDFHAAAQRLIANAPSHGIDLDLLWCSLTRGPEGVFVRQTCMAVPSPGRTGMLFLSAPSPLKKYGSMGIQQSELQDTLRLALTELAEQKGRLSLAQALVEPAHTWAERACEGVGMRWVGRLHFMRLPWSRVERLGPGVVESWPDGITVERVTDVRNFAPGGGGWSVAEALDRSYTETKDCPELCGLRDTRDVVASHMAAGKFDPNRWWVIRRDGQPEGCCLLNWCPANRAVELVYLGISPKVRGMGLGERVLRHALAQVNTPEANELTCAVDTRNEPALKLYHRLGFRSFTSRIGYVIPIGAPLSVSPLENKGESRLTEVKDLRTPTPRG